jgi:hypothetical protein
MITFVLYDPSVEAVNRPINRTAPLVLPAVTDARIPRHDPT